MITKEVSDHLEHFGVKGMRWGVRNAKPKPSRRGSKNRIIGTAAGAGLAFVTSSLIVGSTLNVPLAIIGGATAGTLGSRAVTNMLDKRGNTSVSSIH